MIVREERRCATFELKLHQLVLHLTISQDRWLEYTLFVIEDDNESQKHALIYLPFIPSQTELLPRSSATKKSIVGNESAVYSQSPRPFGPC